MNGFVAALIIIGSLGAFAGFWLLITKLISLGAWFKYAARYAATGAPPPTAERIGGQSLIFGSGLAPTKYKSAINAWIDVNGLYLQPVLLFKMFHPMLFLRWSEMFVLDQRGGRFGQVEVRMRGGGNVPVFRTFGRLGAVIAQKCGQGTMAEMAGRAA